MSETYALEIMSMDGCETCDKRGPQPMRPFPGLDGAVLYGGLCNECNAARATAWQAENERRKLAEWGTIGARKSA